MHKAEWAGSGDDPADKGLYSAYTGAVKYFLMKAFLIPTGDDPEADEGTDKRAAEKPAPRETISEADANALMHDAFAADIAEDQFARAVAHYSGMKAKTAGELTEIERRQISTWIERTVAKNTDKASA